MPDKKEDSIKLSNNRKPKDTKKTLIRILKYILVYKFQLSIVFITIILSSLASIAGTYFLKPLINNYIIPAIGRKNVDLSSFIKMLCVMGVIYLVGVISTYVYNRIMVNISTGTLKRIRVNLFNNMQDLPIKYFDTHTHGEMMSCYTNDTDAMREMLSQSIPQLISCVCNNNGYICCNAGAQPEINIACCLNASRYVNGYF